MNISVVLEAGVGREWFVKMLKSCFWVSAASISKFESTAFETTSIESVIDQKHSRYRFVVIQIHFTGLE